MNYGCRFIIIVIIIKEKAHETKEKESILRVLNCRCKSTQALELDLIIYNNETRQRLKQDNSLETEV